MDLCLPLVAAVIRCELQNSPILRKASIPDFDGTYLELLYDRMQTFDLGSMTVGIAWLTVMISCGLLTAVSDSDTLHMPSIAKHHVLRSCCRQCI